MPTSTSCSPSVTITAVTLSSRRGFDTSLPAAQVLPVVSRVPVLAGVCGTDPFRDMDRFLKEVRDAGFAGVQNFPTVGLIDGVFRQNLEETGMGFDLEVEMIRKASNMGLLTTPYAFDASQVRARTMKCCYHNQGWCV